MKKHFSKELVMAEKNNEDFENLTKCWIYDNNYVDGVAMVLRSKRSLPYHQKI